MAAADDADLRGAAREAAPLGRPSPQPRRRGAARLDLGDRGRPRRVLARLGGERRLTDLGHVGQLLHVAATEQQLGVASLTAWLRQRIADADRDSADEDRALRLDSDAEAVQVLTIHRSKGLEFPIVYHPFAWQPGYIDQDEPPAYPRRPERRRLDDRRRRQRPRHRPAPPAPQSRAARRGPPAPLRRAHPHDAPGDRLVGGLVREPATRRSGGSSSRGTPTASSPRRGRTRPATTRSSHASRQLAAAGAGQDRGREGRGAGRRALGRRAAPDAVELDAARFERTLDARWRRVSYSGIVSGTREQPVASEPELDVVDDELLPDRGDGRRGTLDRRRRAAPASGAGAARRHARRRRRRRPPPPRAGGDRLRERRPRAPSSPRASPSSDAAVTSTSATPTPRSPGSPARSRRRSGPLLDELRLRDVAAADRLDELGFELPLVGGDTPTGTLALSDLASLLETHLPADDPLAGYADRLRDPLVALGPARLPHRDARPRPPHPRRGRLGPLRPRRLQEQLARRRRARTSAPGTTGPPHSQRRCSARTTRCRRCSTSPRCTATCAGGSPATTPTEHLAGVLYLFLRGMTGPDTPRVDGQPVRGLRLAAAGAARRGAERPARPGRRRDVSAFETIDRYDARLRPARATGTLRAFNEAGVLAAADVHVALRLAQLGRGGRREHAARGRARRARTPARIRLRRPRHDRAPPPPPTSTLPVDLQALPWPEPEAWVDEPRLEPARRRRRGRRRGSTAPARRHDALPRPLLARRALRRRRPPRPQRARRRRRRRRARRRAGTAVRRRRARPPAPRRRDLRAAPPRRRRRRPRHRQDDHRHAHPRPPRRAGRGGRSAAAARRPRRTDREGRRAARGSRARRSVGARAERRRSGRDCSRRGRRPSTGCSAGAPAAPTASGTIAATSCRTTS